MLRRFLESFTATHATILAVVAMLGSGAAIAAVAFQPVAIVNTSTGKAAVVDSGGRLYVYDPIAGYRNEPKNQVNFTVSNNGTRCEKSSTYTVPSGKALILTTITGYTYIADSNPFSGFYVYEKASCSGVVRASFLNSGNSTSARTAPVQVEFGSGLVFKSGSVVSLVSNNNFGYTHFTGYLIPSSAAPSTVSRAAASGESDDVYDPGPQVSAVDVANKIRRLGR